MHKSPKVSIILPVWNISGHQTEFGLAINSVLEQTFPNFELIIVDDQSTDGTADILCQIVSTDSRIQVHTNKNGKGLAGALNHALEVAQGEYIVRMDADDQMLPTKLQKQVDFLDTHPDVVVVGTDINITNSHGQIVGVKEHGQTHQELIKDMYKLAALAHPTIMARADTYKLYRYDESLPRSEDVELYFHFEKHGQLANIAEPLYNYQIHDNSNSFKNVRSSLYYTLIARWRVLHKYAHKPSISEWLYNFAQIGLLLLPNRAIKFLYTKLRLEKNLDEVIRYGLVGVATVAIDIASYAALVAFGVNYLLADVLNTPLFLTFNYFAHKHFTFKSNTAKRRDVPRYIALFIFNQIEALIILWVMNLILPGMFIAGKIAQTIILPLTNYFLLKLFVFVVKD